MYDCSIRIHVHAVCVYVDKVCNRGPIYSIHMSII